LSVVILDEERVKMLLEMSYHYSASMPVFPGNPRLEAVPTARIENGATHNGTNIFHHLHNGTHVDAPFHFSSGGDTIDMIPIENFLYKKPFVVECPAKKGELLGTCILQDQMDRAWGADILLFHTGYGEKRDDADIYCTDFPALSHELAVLLRTGLPDLKAIAVDVLSVENMRGAEDGNIVHRTLLDEKLYPHRALLLFEDVNTGVLLGRKCRAIYAFPLRFEGLEASPVSMVAEVESETGAAI
jgi:kynurenine formamidase